MSLSTWRSVRAAAAAACLAFVSACGGGMSGMGSTASQTGTMPGMPGSGCSASSCGSAMVTLTDAKGDFLSYIVTLTSLQLQTANGTSVETVPAATQVDFSQLVDLTEVISAGQIPAATYVSATLTLDYTNAVITADDGTGQGVALKPVDANGNALAGAVSVSVQLDNAHHLVITPGNTGRLAFDFNLAVSNAVDLTGGTVTVSPTLVASVVPSDTKQIRVRGGLASASPAQNDFVLNVQPFHNHGAAAGQVTVQVTPTTSYEINGTTYVGTAGITALAALPASTMVAAFGTLQTTNQMFSASRVLAGTSLDDPAGDQVSGTVIARTQTALTLRDVSWSHHGDDFEFEMKDVTVNVGVNTTVTEEGQMGAFTLADISVGQRVDVFGVETNPDNSGPGSSSSHGAKTFDATAGRVRLDITPAWGVVTALAANSVTLNLQSLGGLPPSVFDFTGTGSSSANDATAAAYVVNTGTLAQTALAVSAPARVFGFVTPFGSAPPDFTAATLVNYASVTDFLVVDWGRMGSTAAFTGLTATSASLVPSFANVGTQHFIQIGPQTLDLTTLPAPAAIVPDSTTMTGLFAIGHAGKFRSDNFNQFSDFVSALSKDLGGTTAVIDVAATGQYDSGTNTFTATRIVVLLSN